MYKEKFSQPIFGANYYSGTTKPLFDMIRGDVAFKIWFMKGGCGKFLRAIKAVLSQIRENRNRAPSSGFQERCNSGVFMQEISYVDPNDPSVFYFEQPPVAMPVGGGAAAGPVPSGAPPSVPGAPPSVVGAPPAVVGAPPSVKIGGPPPAAGAPPPPSVVGGASAPIVISGKKEEPSLYPSPATHYEPTPAPSAAPGSSPYVPPPSFYAPPSGGGYAAPPPSYPAPAPAPSTGYAAPGAYPPPGAPGAPPAFGAPPSAGTGAAAPPAVYPGSGHLPPSEAEPRRGQYYGFFGRDLE